MGLDQAFNVATEFRFDVGEAILNTQALQGAVADLSKTANSAMGALQFLASSMITRMGFGSGGLLTVLTRAVQTSEAFNESALGFSNNISQNMSMLSGDINTFNDRLETSRQLMAGISNTSIKFGLNTAELARLTQLISTPLAVRGKLGTDYAGASSMAKNLMLSSEAVGMNSGAAGESLYRALTEHMPLHGQLFARLVNTPAFKGSHISTQNQLMTMNQDKKIDLLAKALEQLGGNAEFLNARLDRLGVQFQILKDQIELILKPIGDAIVKPLKNMLKQVNVYLGAHGKEIGDNIGKFIGNVFDDPKNLIVGLLQLSRFKADFKRAMNFTSILFVASTATKLLGMKSLAASLESFLGIKGGLGFLAILKSDSGVLMKIFGLVRAALADFIPVVAAFLFFFQVISRARAIAKVHDIIEAIQLIPRAMALFSRMKNALDFILMPITMAIDGLARIIAPLFESTILYEVAIGMLTSLTTVMELLGQGINYVMSGLSSFFYMVIGFFSDLISLKNPFKSMGDNLKTGFNDWMGAHPFNKDPTSNVQNHVTNVGKIEARFDMREQMEPDRIAFAVTDHLKKLAINPTQGRQAGSRSFGFVAGLTG